MRSPRTARLIEWFWLGSLIAGVLIPTASIVLHSHAQPAKWRAVIEKEAYFPMAAIYGALHAACEACPSLYGLSWHEHPARWSNLAYYVGYVRYSLCMLAISLLFLGKLKRLSFALGEWLHAKDHPGPRRIIFAAGVLIVFCWHVKAFPGFFWPGIAGWTFERSGARISRELPTEKNPERFVELAAHPYLSSAVIEDHARYLPDSGYLRNSAMFLHFADGTVLPGNYELSEVTFPNFAFGSVAYPRKNAAVFAAIVKDSLTRRREGRTLFLPSSFTYPNHAPYMRMDYRAYPPAEELRKLSFWTLTAHVDERKRVEIVAAREEATIDVE